VNEAMLNSALASAAQMLRDARWGEAESLLRQLLVENPANPYVLQLLGIASMKRDRDGEGEVFFRQAIAVKPDYVEAHNNLGIVLRKQKKFTEAVVAYRDALNLRSGDADILNNLGNALQDAGEGPAAVEAFNLALEIRPGWPEFMHNLAMALQLQGSAAQAAAIFGQISRMVPEPVFHTNRLFTLHFDPTVDPAATFAEHLEWDRRFGLPLREQIRPHQNDRDANRRLRIGYVSGDFRRHSVAFFIEPLLSNHDPDQVELFAYSTSSRNDDITQRMQTIVPQWRDISELEEGAAAEMIREDAIDILVDLSGHTEGSRLQVFARKPAPVQAAYLGYADTTGLSAIDYRLTDRYLDPAGADRFYSEKLVRLPRSFACYRPLDVMPEVSALPAAARGAATFASFNNMSKISPDLLDCWAEIVSRVPCSRFLMVAHGLESEKVKERIKTIFENRGVSSDRLRLMPRQPWQEYFALHQQADILLDTFPVCGHTVSCHALWMGLPVVTLGGKTCSQRLGVSVLSNLRLEELIAGNRQEYQRIATELAMNLPRLAELRSGLRQRMRESPVMDAKGLARDIEAAYRRMWQAYVSAG
jgi:protein O-GlcNAc transferase